MATKERIYIMQCNDYIKIGVSENPWVRIKSLQTGNPYKIDLLLSFKTKNAYSEEKRFHNYFDSKKSIGEWFKIDDDIKHFVKNLKIIEYKEKGGEY